MPPACKKGKKKRQSKKDQVKQKRNKYKSAHGECKKRTKSLKSLKSLTKKKRHSDIASRKNYCSTKAINRNKISFPVKGGK